MPISKSDVLDQLRRVKGPDLKDNIVDLGLVSDVVIRDDRVMFSITVPASRAEELEPLRQAAEKVVANVEGVKSVIAVLTAEAGAGRATASSTGVRGAVSGEHRRVQEARAKAAAAGVAPSRDHHAHDHGHDHTHDHGHDHGHGHTHANGGAPAARSAPPRPAAPGAKPAAAPKAAGVPGVKHLIAVASGKGGVGKSTTAVNLALAMQANGLKVGILDADIYGPSQPRLLGLTGRPQVAQGNVLRPMEGFGLKAMSMGFLVDEATPIIWRGPMVVSALNQMLREVAWGDLDVLVIDMPPGTGDVQLSMAQQVPLSGAVIVSTPQDLALIDARKGLNMFRKVDVPVLGIIENMSMFICPKCGERSDIFGHGGARDEAERLGIPFLGGVPLHMEIRARSDSGQPVVVSNPEGPHAAIYREIASRVWTEVQAASGLRVESPALDVGADGARLTVSFSDGESHALSAEMLRVMSPSAEVQGHSPSERVTVPKKRNVKIKELRPVGNYAVRIVFDDGHDTGLYGWDYLRTLGRETDQRWAAYLAELEAKGLSRG